MRRKALRQHDKMSDEALLGASRAGDTEAFAALWERHRKAGLTAARNIAPSLDPEDVVSDAYLRVFELVLDGRGPQGAFRPYLYQVIRSAAADRFRAGELSAVELPDIPDLHEAAPWEDNAFDLNAVTEAFATLNPRWQAVLWYTEVEGLPPREAAKHLGLSANSTSALAVRAKDALKSAWVEAHVNRELSEGAHRFTLEHLQRYQRGKLTARLTREVEAHLDNCESCALAAVEHTTLNRQLGLVLAWVSLGSVGAGALVSQLGLAGGAGAVGASASIASTGGAGASAGVGGGIASAGAPALVIGGTSVLAVAAAGATAFALTLGGPAAPPVSAQPIPSEQSVVDGDSEGSPPAPPAQRGQAKQNDDEDDSVAGGEGLSDSVTPPPQPPAPLPEEPATTDPVPPVAPPVTPPVTPPVKPPVTPPVKPPLGKEDPSITVTPLEACFSSKMRGWANREGFVQLRATAPGGEPVLLVAEVPLEGAPSDGLTLAPAAGAPKEGYYARTESAHVGNWWKGPDPTQLPAWEEDLHGLSLEDVFLEIRLVVPSGDFSSWREVPAGAVCA